jgi:hypothetical protein
VRHDKLSLYLGQIAMPASTDSQTGKPTPPPVPVSIKTIETNFLRAFRSPLDLDRRLIASCWPKVWHQGDTWMKWNGLRLLH